MSISDTTESAILALIFNATTWANYAINASVSPEANIAVALHTADPGDAGTMATSEIAYTGYARLAGPLRTSGGFTVSGTAPTQVVPVAAITFGAGTAGAGTASFFSYGKSGGGAAPILLAGTVTPNIVCGSGVTPQLSTATAVTLD